MAAVRRGTSSSIVRRFDRNKNASSKTNSVRDVGTPSSSPLFGHHQKTGSFGGGNKVADPIWIDDDGGGDEFCFMTTGLRQTRRNAATITKAKVKQFRTTRTKTMKSSPGLLKEEKLKTNGKWSIVCGINDDAGRFVAHHLARAGKQNRESGAERNSK